MPISNVRLMRAKRSIGGLTLSAFLGLLAVGLLLALVARPARAAGTGSIVVNPGQSIQAAINAANPGDTIQINAGYYTESLTLDKAVNLLGANAATTIIQAMPGQRVITVTGAAVNQTVLIAHLTLQGGDVDGATDCPNTCGGGMLITNTAQPLLQNLVFRHNAAWQGGGLYAVNSLTLTEVVLHDNTALDIGGGLVIALTLGPDYQLTLIETQFISNTAGGGGGGMFVAGPATITGGLFERNRCTGFPCDAGGSFTRGLTISGTRYLSNTSTWDGGGASNYVQLAALTGGTFEGNRCTALGCQGGGLNAEAGAAITNTQFISNSSAFNGGGARVQSGALAVTGARFERNTCTEAACSGGGLAAFSSVPSADIATTDFYSNTAGLDGGGLRVGALLLTGGVVQGNTCTNVACGGGGLNASNTANVNGVRFIANTAQNGGGGAFFSGIATVEYSEFTGNDCLAASCVGGGLRAENELIVSAVQFVDNTSVGAGGGLAQTNTAGTLRVVNALFAGNTADKLGLGLWAASTGSGQVLHTTFANPTVFTGAAVGVGGGSLGLTNTIVASYTIGISLTAGAANENYMLFFGVALTTTGGVASGANHPAGYPRFADPGDKNYHLLTGSPAIDAGVFVGVATDVDAETRPAGGGYDLGFDEYVNLPPLAVSDTYSTPVNTPLVVAAPGVLANDSDSNADALTVGMQSPPSSGSLSLALNGGLVFTPSLNFAGQVTFAYRAYDGLVNSNSVFVTITVGAGPAQQLYLPLVLR